MIDHVLVYYWSYMFNTPVCIIASDRCTTPFGYLGNILGGCMTRSSFNPRDNYTGQ